MRPLTRGGGLVLAIASCRRHFAFALLFSGLVNLLFLAPMLYMLQVYERVVPTRGGTTLAMLTLVLLFALVTMSGLDVMRSRLLVRAGVRLDARLAESVLDAAVATTDRGNARTARQAIREFDLLRQALTGPTILALLDAPWVPVYIAAAFLLHPWIGVLAVVGATLVILLAVRNEQVSREPLQAANRAAGQTYTEFDFTVTSSDVVRALGMRRALVARHLAQRESLIGLQTDASLASGGLTATSRFVRQFLQSLALGVGALLAIDGKISPGAVFASMFIVGRALAPVDQLVGNWRAVVQARGAWQTLRDLLDEAPPDLKHTLLPTPAGRIETEQLHFWVDDGPPILQNVSFRIEPGELVAIVGPSGAGKSTLVRLLARASVPRAGIVRLDGSDQRNWDPEQYARHVGFMPQEPVLFAGTVKENIARFRNQLPGEDLHLDADVIAAAQEAGAHGMIQRLAGGYDQPLGLGGRGLSAGQSQRIALARALFRRPAVLILDEPNSNLDAEGDEELARCLGKLKARGTTVLMVAHRMSMLPIVDRLMVIKDGRLSAFGPRDDVLKLLAPARRVPSTAALEA